MKFNRELFDIYFFPAESPADSRVDIAVGLKVSKKAVVRNRLKRQIKEILRKYTKIGSFEGKYIKVTAKSLIKDKKFDYIKKDLEVFLDKIR